MPAKGIRVSRSWLVTGGAGYIGTHIVAALIRAGDRVVVLDDLSTGHAKRLHGLAPLVRGSVHDVDLVARVLRRHDVNAVIHAAARTEVSASFADPAGFHRANVGGLQSVLAAMSAADVRRLVFASSAAVYGAGLGGPLAETGALRPLNPYGWSKLHGEQLLHDHAVRHGLRFVVLRYFNVAGTDDPQWLQANGPSVLSTLCDALLAGTPPQINGADYLSRDGTCVRDFIHVADVADANLAVAALLDRPGCAATFNVGRGVGSTIGELIAELGRLTGLPVAATVGPRRAGDVCHSVADISKLRHELGWQARHSLAQIIATHWEGCQAAVRPASLPIARSATTGLFAS